MLTGNPPYYDEHIPTLYKNIQEGNLVFPKTVSEHSKDLIKVAFNLNKILIIFQEISEKRS